MNYPKTCAAVLVGLVLSAVPLRAGVLSGDGIGAYGDSLTMQYSFLGPILVATGSSIHYDGHQLNWVDHLVSSGYNFGAQIDATGYGNYYNEYDAGVAGAVSSDLQDQVGMLESVLASGAVKLTVVEIGGNDFGGTPYQSIYNNAANPGYHPLADPAVQSRIDSLISNIRGAVDATLAVNPGERMILNTLTDLALSPLYAASHPDAARRAAFEEVVLNVNQQILDLAAQHHFPVVDFDGLAKLVQSPPQLAGVTLYPGGGTSDDRMFLSDGFHPGTVFQGWYANAILLANQVGYGDPVNLISDQTILTRTGLHPTVAGPTYFDVSPYVIYNAVPEPSSLALAVVGLLGLVTLRAAQTKRCAARV